MQCPLCRESVADDNALQVHYLMSCRGYLESSSSKQNEAPPSKKLVQFRWMKSKPTLAREVYLISSLAGSVKLDWRMIDECFLSDQVEVPQGLHVCQLVVDSDAMSTDDFTVSDSSRTIDIVISEVPEDPIGDVSDGENEDVATQPVPRPDHRDEQDGESEITTQKLPEKGSLYHELLNHQMLHGDSLETLTGGSSGEPGRSLEGKRTRGNGVATRTTQSQRNTHDEDLTHTTRPDDNDHTTRAKRHFDRHGQRQQNDVLPETLSSDELQQFLQPTRTRQESNGDVGEDRESSLSDNEEPSISLSSHDGFERRPELLGQSNGENESRVQTDAAEGVTDHVTNAGSQTGSHEESVSGHRQEARLIDLSEPSSEIDRKASSKDSDPLVDDRDRPSNDQQGMPKADPRLLLDNDGRDYPGSLREEITVNDLRRPSHESRERPSSGRHKQSSGVLREQTLGGGREPPEDDREPTEGNRETLESHHEDLTNNLKPLGDNRQPLEDTRERSQNNSELLSSDREQSVILRTEASGHRREETSSGLQEKSGADPISFDRQERTGSREKSSGDDRPKATYREGISETQNNNSRYGRTLFSNDNEFMSLPATFTSDHNTRPQHTVQSGLYSGDLISLRGSDTLLTDSHGLDSQTRGRISPRSSATTGITLTGSRRLADTTSRTTTDDLLFRNRSSSASRTHAVLGKDADAQRKDFSAYRSHSTPTSETSARSTHIPQNKDTPQTEDVSTTVDIPPTTDIPRNTETPQSRDVTALSRDVSTSRSDTLHGREFHPSRDITSQIRDTAQSRAITPRSEESHRSRDITVPRTDTSTSTRDRNPSSKASRSEQSPSNIPEDDNSPALARCSPQGSIANSDIRRPPLYTSAPSRPHSSLPYTSHIAISPLCSPRDGVSTESLGSSATAQSRVDRVAPAGSTVGPEGPQTVPSTTTSKQFSGDQIKELLENLRKESATKPGGSPESSPRERPAASEITSLKGKLAERDEIVKNLREKNARYKASNDKLRDEVMDLTKNLSLAEASKNRLKEQEEISSELENALGEKELECAQLKEQVYEVERKQRRMAIKHDQAKKDYEKKIQDFQKMNDLLEQDVKKLRESSSRNTSPRSSKEYKRILEELQNSLAVSASLEDQVQTLKKENSDLKEKLKSLSPRSRQENVTSYTRDLYTSRSEVGTRWQDYSSVNGYSDGDTFQRLTADDRDLTGNVRRPYDGYQPVIEHSRHRRERNSLTNRSRPQSEITRNRLAFENFPSGHEGLPERLGSPRDRTDIFGSERSAKPPREERSRSREPRSRQRFTTADDDTLGVSNPDYTRVLHRRSHSSDSIRNAFPDGSRSRISPSQERDSQELDRRSKRESRPHYSGSSDNLYPRPTSLSPTGDLTLTRYHAHHTPTSPEETSLRSKRTSSPGKGSPFAPDTPQQIDIGMTVLVSRNRGKLSRGVVKFIGYLPEKKDQVYVGLELHDADGKHDGKFNGHRFFKCPANHGVFVLFEKIVMAYT